MMSLDGACKGRQSLRHTMDTAHNMKINLFDVAPYFCNAPGFLIQRSYLVTYDIAARVMKKYFDIEPRHVWTLIAAQKKELSQQVIADMLGINRNSMVKVVDDLERLQMIHRVRNLENRREFILSLTKKGEQVVHRVLVEIQEEAHKEMFKGISVEEMKELNRILCKVVIEEVKVNRS